MGQCAPCLDAALVLSIGLQEAGNLEAVFKAAGFLTELRRDDDEDPIPAMLRARDSYGNTVDLLLGMRGMEPQAFARVVEVPFQGTTLKVIGREDFVAMKAFAGGPTDLADAARVMAADRDSLDMALLRRLARRFGQGAADRLERLLAE